MSTGVETHVETAAQAASPSSQAILRYTRFAILLHWIIAAMILAQIAAGFWIADALQSTEKTMRLAAYEQAQIHKSLGLTILALSVLRLAWRLVNPAPPLPEGMSLLERAGAHASHIGFYVLMIAMPLSGWLMVSHSATFSSVPTVYFGLFEVPHLPLPPVLGAEAKASFGGLSHQAHGWLAISALVLLALHVGAALKHHYVDRAGVLARMTPGVRPRGDAGDVAKVPYREAVGGLRWALALALAVGLGGAAYGISQYAANTTSVDVAVETTSSGPEDAMSGMAQAWGVVETESVISFETENAGDPVVGQFTSWKALIEFDADDLAVSEVVVIVDIPSISTGDLIYDGSLVEPDWFYAAAFPKGTFVAKEFVAGGSDGEYVAKGSLTLRGVEKPYDLPFSLSIDGDRAEMSSQVMIDRSDFGIGVKADPDGMWVPMPVQLKVKVVALRAN